jgi:hypothetical protein
VVPSILGGGLSRGIERQSPSCAVPSAHTRAQVVTRAARRADGDPKASDAVASAAAPIACLVTLARRSWTSSSQMGSPASSGGPYRLLTPASGQQPVDADVGAASYVQCMEAFSPAVGRKLSFRAATSLADSSGELPSAPEAAKAAGHASGRAARSRKTSQARSRWAYTPSKVWAATKRAASPGRRGALPKTEQW